MSDDCWVKVTTTFGPDVAGTLIVAALSPPAAPVPPPLPAALQYACASALSQRERAEGECGEPDHWTAVPS